MHNLNDLAIFAAVVSQGGFSAAARVLGLPKSSVSRRVTALESDLGVRLLQRSTRAVSLTEVGKVFYQHCADMEGSARAAYDTARNAVGRTAGRVRVSSPAGLADLYLAEALPAFLMAFPQVQVEIELTNRRVDVIGEGFDAALRIRTSLDDSELVMRSFGVSPQVLVASPQFVAAHGPFLTPGSLNGKPGLGPRGHNGEQPAWHLRDANGVQSVVGYESSMQVAHGSLLLRGALAGAGIAQLPLNLCHKELKAGKLILLLPKYRLPEHLLHVVYPSRRGLAPAVRAFVEYLADVLPVQMEEIISLHAALTQLPALHAP